jgi:signal transduction histidine kinase
VWHYVVAIAITMLLLSVHYVLGRWADDPLLAEHSPFLLLVTAVFISTFIGGFGPGVVATLMCALASTYLFIAPTFALRIDSRASAGEVALFIVEGLLIAYLTSRLQTARHQADVARQAAEAALRTRDTFLSVAAHELRNPISALIGAADLLERRARQQQSTERDLRMVRLMASQARRLHRLVAALLDVSRLQRGDLSLDCRPLDLRTVVQQVVDEIAASLDTHSVQVAVGDEPLPVHGDELRLEQVVYNLLQNAVKYSPQGGPILVQLERRDGLVCCAVQDHGIGIAAHAQQHIWKRFYRAPNAEHGMAGLGIGLSVVHDIVTLHGGTVHVASREGRGSTFTVCLPLLRKHMLFNSIAAQAHAVEHHAGVS